MRGKYALTLLSYPSYSDRLNLPTAKSILAALGTVTHNYYMQAETDIPTRGGVSRKAQICPRARIHYYSIYSTLRAGTAR